jgi:hypothetical protein
VLGPEMWTRFERFVHSSNYPQIPEGGGGGGA